MTKFVELSPRLQDVARLVADGYSNRMIAKELSISEQTVRLHVNRLGKVMGINGEVRRLRPFITRLALEGVVGAQFMDSGEEDGDEF